MNVYEKLREVQFKLKAPKNQYNSFGKYSYRSCEDILEGLKPILYEVNANITLSDEIFQVGNRFYLRATAKFTDCESGESVEVSSLAREDETKKGMDLAQVTGSVSSYARKYALNGLFAIDDTKDSDVTNTHEKKLSENQLKRLYALAKKCEITNDKLKIMIFSKYQKEISELSKTEYDHICDGLQAKIDKEV
jgi:hypothetical protein